MTGPTHYHAKLTPRWTVLRPHPEQIRLRTEKRRFKIVAAGRRSGKTEHAKRHAVEQAMRVPFARFGCGAPTWMQAKGIFWDDLVALVPQWARRKKDSVGELTIHLKNGTDLCVAGLDKPARIEGKPWHGWVLDEYANMRAEAWPANIRPTLAETGGWCWFTGVPEGRNHYYHLKVRNEGQPDWGFYSWFSADILPPEEVEAARRDTDELTFQQEYEGSFVNFHGQAYYTFNAKTNTGPVRDRYNPAAPLIVCFDFNVEPGVAAICQELTLFKTEPTKVVSVGGLPFFRSTGTSEQTGTAVLGEVHIPRNSNTVAVCRKIVKDWGAHQGTIECYGDATGGARGTAKLEGNDWDLIRRELRAHFGVDRVNVHVDKSNPSERSRINAVNTRCRTQDGTVRLMVDPRHAPHVILDLEGVRLLEGGSGEIDKKADPELSHISDALGYYIVKRFPVTKAASLKSEATRI